MYIHVDVLHTCIVSITKKIVEENIFSEVVSQVDK